MSHTSLLVCFFGSMLESWTVKATFRVEINIQKLWFQVGEVVRMVPCIIWWIWKMLLSQNYLLQTIWKMIAMNFLPQMHTHACTRIHTHTHIFEYSFLFQSQQTVDCVPGAGLDFSHIIISFTENTVMGVGCRNSHNPLIN